MGSLQLAHLLSSGALARDVAAAVRAAAAEVRAATGAGDSEAEARVAALLRGAMLPPFDEYVRGEAYSKLTDGEAYVAVKADGVLIRVLSFCFCTSLRLRLSPAAAAQAQIDARVAAPLLRLSNMPPAVRAALGAYNDALLQTTQTYLRVGILRGSSERPAADPAAPQTLGWGPAGAPLPPAARLPLSGVCWGAAPPALPAAPAAAAPGAGAAAPLVTPCVLRSPFSALRGRGDRFRSLRELASELRGGVILHQVRAGGPQR